MDFSVLTGESRGGGVVGLQSCHPLFPLGSITDSNIFVYKNIY